MRMKAGNEENCTDPRSQDYDGETVLILARGFATKIAFENVARFKISEYFYTE